MLRVRGRIPKRLALVLALIAVVLLPAVPPLAAVRTYREFRGFTWHFLGGFNEVYISPQGTTRLKVVIIDGGALGWGCIKFYRHSLLTGYSYVSRHCEAAAYKGATVEWTDETHCRVTFTDPDTGLVTLPLDLR